MINTTSISLNIVSTFKDKVLTSLNEQQKKILLIASLAFGCLVICYLIKRCFEDIEAIQYEGTVINGKLEGQGKKILPDKTEYTGTFVGGLLNGLGKIERPNHSVTEGIFVNDVLHGQGTVIFPNGIFIQGEFENGTFMEGKVTWANDVVFDGQRIGGLLCGKLIRKNKQESTLSGFKDMPLVGHGKFVAHNGDVFEGEFKNYKVYKGIYTKTDGTILDGQFDNLSMFKKGIIKYPNGKRFEGVFEGKIRQGILTHEDGTIDEGSFSDKWIIADGPIKITFTDGTVYEGEFDTSTWELTGTKKDASGEAVENGSYRFSLQNGSRVIEKIIESDSASKGLSPKIA